MKKYRVEYYFKNKKDSPKRQGRIDIAATNQWNAIGRAQVLYCNYHYFFSIIRVTELVNNNKDCGDCYFKRSKDCLDCIHYAV